MTSQYGHGFLSIFFGGKYDLIQLHRQIVHQNDGISDHEKLIEIFTSSIYFFKFKGNKENNMTFCHFSCLAQCYFRQLCRPKQLLTLASLL